MAWRSAVSCPGAHSDAQDYNPTLCTYSPSEHTQRWSHTDAPVRAAGALSGPRHLCLFIVCIVLSALDPEETQGSGQRPLFPTPCSGVFFKGFEPLLFGCHIQLACNAVLCE